MSASTRGGDRLPVSLRIRLKYGDEARFIERFSSNISRGGVFIATRTPRTVDTAVRFEFQLADGQPVIRGLGRVAWVKAFDPARPEKPHGMGVRFEQLDEASQGVIERALAWKEQSRQRAQEARRSPRAAAAETSPVPAGPDPGAPTFSLAPAFPTPAPVTPAEEASPSPPIFAPKALPATRPAATGSATSGRGKAAPTGEPAPMLPAFATVAAAPSSQDPTPLVDPAPAEAAGEPSDDGIPLLLLDPDLDEEEEASPAGPSPPLALEASVAPAPVSVLAARAPVRPMPPPIPASARSVPPAPPPAATHAVPSPAPLPDDEEDEEPEIELSAGDDIHDAPAAPPYAPGESALLAAPAGGLEEVPRGPASPFSPPTVADVADVVDVADPADATDATDVADLDALLARSGLGASRLEQATRRAREIAGTADPAELDGLLEPPGLIPLPTPGEARVLLARLLAARTE